MKKIILLALIGICSISCGKIFKENDEVVSGPTSIEYQIDGEKNEFGCVESAGYSWSILRNECIRIYEIGYRLNPVNHNSNDVVISAFVLFNEAKDKVELYLPDRTKSIILTKNGENTFENNMYRFNSKDFYLAENNVKKYEAAAEHLENIDESHEDIDAE